MLFHTEVYFLCIPRDLPTLPICNNDESTSTDSRPGLYNHQHYKSDSCTNPTFPSCGSLFVYPVSCSIFLPISSYVCQGMPGDTILILWILSVFTVCLS